MKRIEAHEHQRVFALEDTTRHRLDAAVLMDGAGGRFPASKAGHLAEQFLRINRPTFEAFEIEAYSTYDGRGVDLVMETGRQVGALPLKSPTSGSADYGMVVKPRFGWSGVGPVLAQTGWRVTPDILNLPQLPKSDREVPPWVLSSVILPKIRSLLHDVDRRFEFVDEDRRAPRGRVDWQTYATKRLSRGRFLDVPCHFPDLRDDRDLMGAIHFALRSHRASLETQRGAGAFVRQLLEMCERLLRHVRLFEPRPPRRQQLERWKERAFGGDDKTEAIQAIQWTAEQRGLAGLGELEGLPWLMPMETFFEAWLEFIAQRIAQKFGGTPRSGRKRETVVPLHWEPDYAGSQQALLPDMVIEQMDRTIILDAKYKRHFEEIASKSWHAIARDVRQRHRKDLLQVLAYAATSQKSRVTTCLVYPCREGTWTDLERRGRVVHRTQLGAAEQQVDLLLAAVPIGAATERAAEVLGRAVSGR